jgi:Lipopolysaccharide export system permease LptF/LptG
MIRPGDRLRAMAARIFDQRTMARVVDPLVADLQVEYAEAIRRGRAWRSRWILVAGYFIFLKTIAVCGAEEAIRSLGVWTVDDRSAMSRTLGFSVIAIAAATAVLAILPLGRFTPLDPRLLVYLIPQALVLAVPIGVTVGILLGLRGRLVSRRSTGVVLASAIFCSLLCLAMLAWIGPLANQEFRQLAFGQERSIVSKGFGELTLGELSQQIDSYRRVGLIKSSSDSELWYTYHMRWALSCATLVLALFALSVTRRLVARWTVALAAFGACFSYYWLLWIGRAAALQETLPAFVGAWLPNLAFVVVSVALLRAASPKSRLELEP